jgi:type II secretory pathway pseudopilin PulG
MSHAHAMQGTSRAHAKRAGLTLVEVSALLSVVGMLLAVAIPTLARTLRASKVAEASEQLDYLFRAAARYYAVPRADPQLGRVHCLPEAAGPAPNLPSPTGIVVDFNLAQGAATWKALGFAPRGPLRYRYTFLPAAAGCWVAPPASASSLSLRAEGDLDGDGVYSHFELLAHVAGSGKLTLEPVLHVYDRIE